MNYTYSIIIPHYQSIKLLKRLLCSIPERFDIQVLVVDDNSSQDVQQQLFSLKHLNLTICLQPENYGAGSARNIGLKKPKVNGFCLQMLMIFLMTMLLKY